MTSQALALLEGGCSCRGVRYRMSGPPMIVHACHCTWCQRESGTGFAVNAVIERSRVEVTGEVERVDTPSASGKGQQVARCVRCKVALWSHYPQSGTKVAFIRVGTLDTPAACPPDVHIFTSTKVPWLTLPPGARAFAEFYKGSDGVWSAEAAARRKAAMSS